MNATNSRMYAEVQHTPLPSNVGSFFANTSALVDTRGLDLEERREILQEFLKLGMQTEHHIVIKLIDFN